VIGCGSGMLVRMKAGIILCLLAIAGASALSAEPDDSDDQCKQYLHTPLPAEAANIAAPKTWPDCESYKSYSGIGRKVDYVAARKCAWSERSAQQSGKAPDYDLGSYLGGSAMLTVLYANGEGVEQNTTLALRFACEASLSQDGFKAIQALSASAGPGGKKFDYCEHAMSTPEMNLCTEYRVEIATQKRKSELDQLSSHMTPEQKVSFDQLRKASEEYVSARGMGEVYQGGTIRTMRTFGAEERMRDKFVEALKVFESGRLPKGAAADFEKADADLNETYKRALELAAKQNFDEDDGAIRLDGIHQAQRAWIKYRDAWVAFAKVRYPHTDTNAWLTLLTRNRYWSLRQTACRVGWNDNACQSKEDE